MKKHDPIQAMECIKTLNRLNILPTAEELMLLLIAIHRYNTQGLHLRLHLSSSIDTTIDNTTSSTAYRANDNNSDSGAAALIYQRDQKALIRDADQLIEFLSYHLLGFKYDEAVQLVSYINRITPSSSSSYLRVGGIVGGRECEVGEEEEVGILIESEAALHGLLLDRDLNSTKTTSVKLNDNDGSTTNNLVPCDPTSITTSSSSTSISVINSNNSSANSSYTNGTYTTILATNTTFLDLITNSDFTSMEASLIAVNGNITYIIILFCI